MDAQDRKWNSCASKTIRKNMKIVVELSSIADVWESEIDVAAI